MYLCRIIAVPGAVPGIPGHFTSTGSIIKYKCIAL